MSGGSFDYLFAKRLSDAIDFDSVARMAALLREMDTPASAMLAMRMEDLYGRLRQTERDFDGLSEVMRTVEWWQSGDYSPEQVDEACKKWLEEL